MDTSRSTRASSGYPAIWRGSTQQSTGHAKLIHAPKPVPPQPPRGLLRTTSASSKSAMANRPSAAQCGLGFSGKPRMTEPTYSVRYSSPVARVSCQGRLLCVCSLQTNQRRIVAKMGKADHENPASNSNYGSEFGMYRCSAAANDDRRFWRPDVGAHQCLQGEPRPVSAGRKWHFESIGPTT